MAFSPTDPASAHSLWLQLRHSKRKCRSRWRSDWTPLWVPLLLLSVLLILYAILPSNDAAEHAQQAAHEEGVLQSVRCMVP
jgi:hypothetical protein